MRRIIRLSEQDLTRIVRRVIRENEDEYFQLETDKLGMAIAKRLTNVMISASEDIGDGVAVPNTFQSYSVKGFDYVIQPTKVKSPYLIPFIGLQLNCQLVKVGSSKPVPAKLSLNISMKNGYPSRIITAMGDKSLNNSEINKKVLPLIKDIRI